MPNALRAAALVGGGGIFAAVVAVRDDKAGLVVKIGKAVLGSGESSLTETDVAANFLGEPLPKALFDMRVILVVGLEIMDGPNDAYAA